MYLLFEYGDFGVFMGEFGGVPDHKYVMMYLIFIVGGFSCKDLQTF